MTVVLTILAFAGLIVFHELGHFLLARATGMRVETFAVGFGPTLLSRTYGETKYALCAVPLGGYVKISGMDPTEEDAKDDPRSYLNKTPLQRILVILAGPVFNYILAAVIFAIVLLAGPMEPDFSKAVIGDVLAGDPAATAGVLKGDRIVGVDEVEISDWASFQAAVYARAEVPSKLRIDREGEQLTLDVTPKKTLVDGQEVGLIGVVPKGKRGQGKPLGDALLGGVLLTWDWNVRIVSGLYKIIRGKEEANFQGPVGIVDTTAKAAAEGMIPLLILVAIISVHLGLFNLLPIPALDGGRLVFLGWEVVSRRPVNARVELAVHAVGFLLLIGLMIVVTIGDIGRLWGSPEPEAPAAVEDTQGAEAAP
ncbi:MAG: RIP metalloprotease RseP [Deltaproteobacteria bacterium]|nr:RIP metalloprotease RseP [Deltaproteobacteria bacterium]